MLETIVTFGSVVVGLGIVIRELRKMDQNAERRHQEVLKLTQPRQSTIGMGRRSTQDPPVDFRPVTTRRDTDDLPSTARQRHMAVRQGGDLHGNSDDGRLPTGS